jgi:predicted Fe-Mo cluster-binding NifX family protein
MAKAAVGSTDGANIDVHFRKAEFFDIYDIAPDGSIAFLEKRTVLEDSLEGVVALVTDVDIVLIRFIGQHAADELTKHDIAYAAVNLPVEKALAAFAKRGSLLSNPVGQCNCGEAPPRREDCPIRALKGL